MAKFSVPDAKTKYSITSGSFLGVDRTTPPGKVSLARSPEAPNMIRDTVGVVRKRYGIKTMRNYNISTTNQSINGVHFWTSGTTTKKFVHAGTYMYMEFPNIDTIANYDSAKLYEPDGLCKYNNLNWSISDGGIASTTEGEKLATLSGRVYYKKNDGAAYIATVYDGTNTNMLLVGRTADSVVYTCAAGDQASVGSLTYGGSTWYYAGYGASMPGDLANTDGKSQYKISSTGIVLATAVTTLLAHVIGITPSDSSVLWHSEIFSSTMASHISVSSQINGKLWILDGTTFWVYDGTTFTSVYSSSFAYIPTILIARAPTGGGTKLEDVNLLNKWMKVTFAGDSTTRYYQLPYSSIDSDAVIVEKMNSSGTFVTLTAGTDYVQYNVGGQVYFNTIPGVSPITGEDNVRITFAKTISGYADKINKCDISVLYGINGARNRLFVSGNPSFQNYDYFSAENNPGYFGDLSYSVIGQDDSAIMGYAIVNNYLVTHKSGAENDNNANLRSGSIVNSKAVFASAGSYQTVSALAKHSFAILENEPLYVTSTKKIAAIAMSEVTGERFSQERSYRLSSDLVNDAYLGDSYACVHNNMYFLASGSKIYVLDGLQYSVDKNSPYSSRQYEAYYLPNITARIMWEENGELWFGTSDGYMKKFAKGTYADDAPYVWKMVNAGNTFTYQNGIAKYTAISQYDGILQRFDYTKYRSHVMYFRANVKTNSVDNYLVLNDGIGQTVVPPTGSNVFERLSGIHTISSNASDMFIKVQDGRTSGWTETQVDDVVLIDLTSNFGSGNEPTLTWCDANISNNYTNIVINGDFSNMIAISAYWDTPEINGGSFADKKTFVYIAARLAAYVRTSVKFRARVKGIWETLMDYNSEATYIDFSNINFANFTFSTDVTPHTIGRKIKLKNVDKVQFRFENSVNNEPFALYDAIFKYTEGSVYEK